MERTFAALGLLAFSTVTVACTASGGTRTGAAGAGAAGSSAAGNAGAAGDGTAGLGVAGAGAAGSDAPDGGAKDAPVGADAAKDAPADVKPVADVKPPTDVSDAKAPLEGGLPGKGFLAVTWGRNAWSATHPDQATWEKPLAETCTAHPEYDIVILSGAIKLVHTRNMTTTLPELDFSSHCAVPYDANNPFLLKCDDIAVGIRTCQSLGKKVLLSIGGAAGSAGFVDDVEARASATATWNTFLGGTSAIRPFVNATLDGIVLDIQAGPTVGYTAFVKALRPLMDNSGRKYFITASPQCPFPDPFLGPMVGKPLTDAPTAIDFVFVRFYDATCGYGTPQAFRDSFAMWKTLLGAKSDGPRVIVGLPATATATTSGFVPRATLPALLGDVKADPAFAGLMLWDVSNDQNSLEAGTTYGAFAKPLLK